MDLRVRRRWTAWLTALATTAATLAAGLPATAATAVPAPPPAYPFTGTWQGQSVSLTHVANVTVEGLPDATLAGQLASFQTDDPSYSCLNGENITVWTAPTEFPGDYVVHNGGQGSQCAYGTWTFPQEARTGSLTVTVGVSPGTFTAGQVQQVTWTVGLSEPVSDGTVALAVTGPGGQVTQIESGSAPSAGSYVFTDDWSFDAAGTWTVAANWSGDSRYGPAEGTTSVTVGAPQQQNAGLTVTASPDPATVGQTVTLTATLSQPVSDGRVSFALKDPDGNVLVPPPCTPSNGACGTSLQTAGDAAGSYGVSATWSGDGQYGPSSGTAELTLNASSGCNPASPACGQGACLSSGSGTPGTLTVTASPDPATAGQAVTLTATLAQPASDGQVAFCLSMPPSGGNAVLIDAGSCTPSGGSCTVTVPTAGDAAGTYDVGATWSGDAQYGPASGTTGLSLDPASPLTLTASPDPATVGQTLTVTATLGQPASDGQVAFALTIQASNGVIDVGPAGTCTPSGGSCASTFPTAGDPAGTYEFTATWSGDSQYGPASGTIGVPVDAPCSQPLCLGSSAEATVLQLLNGDPHEQLTLKHLLASDTGGWPILGQMLRASGDPHESAAALLGLFGGSASALGHFLAAQAGDPHESGAALALVHGSVYEFALLLAKAGGSPQGIGRLLQAAGGDSAHLRTFLGAAALFDDISGQWGWAAPSIAQLALRGVLKGVAAGRFDPAGHVTRAQFAALMTRLFHLQPPASPVTFVDVPPGFWAHKAIEAAAPYMSRFRTPAGPAFHPSLDATRIEVAATIGQIEVADHLAQLPSAQQAQALWSQFQDGSQVPAGLATDAAVALQAGFLKGYPDGRFGVHGPITRAEAAVLLLRVLQSTEPSGGSNPRGSSGG